MTKTKTLLKEDRRKGKGKMENIMKVCTVDNVPDKQKWRKIVNIFLSINLNISFGSSNCSIEYTQHVFCLKNKKINI